LLDAATATAAAAGSADGDGQDQGSTPEELTCPVVLDAGPKALQVGFVCLCVKVPAQGVILNVEP
jgi:hypothetical protein